tara:strand:- start:202 stop:2067 length:1866 start_codon:yes stop_codon:yes gene_type:complete
MSKVIGIDLGTTNSAVAVIEGNSPGIILNEEGTRTTPSVVGFSESGELLVGAIARRQAVINPENTIYSVKRFMGSTYKEISKEAKRMPYEIFKTSAGVTAIKIKGKEYAPPEISARILQKLKRAAEKHLGEDVTEAVITVPAYFNDAQRQATKDAGKIAGLEVRRIINEPTAAALAYGLDKNKDELIAVYDFGGGTFDISVLEVSENVVEVISTAGDTRLGGDNVDEAIIEHLLNTFQKDTGMDISKDPSALQRIKEAAEKAKVELSSTVESEINLPFITADATGPKHLVIKITRAKLEQMIEPIIKKTFTACRRVLKDAGKKAKDIDQVILVGGSTRIPKVAEAVTKFFGKEPNRSVNPDEVVALGAAVQGGVLSGDVTDVLLLDVTPLSLGIETMGNVTTRLIERNATIPTKKTEIFSTAADNQSSVEVHVLQGEREMAGDNRSLGKFNLDGLPPAPRGVPQIEVIFDIDVNGILNVIAKDKATGKDQSIIISDAGSISETEIQEMIDNAKVHEEKDKATRALIEAKNGLGSLVHQAGATVAMSKEKLDESKISEIEIAIETAKVSLESDDIEEINGAASVLSSVMQEVAQLLYSQTEENPDVEDVEEEGIIDAEVVNG